jgi:serine protease Do
MKRQDTIAFLVAIVALAATIRPAAAQTYDPTAIATALSQAFAKAADIVKPAVANISTTHIEPGRRIGFPSLFGDFLFGPGPFTTPDREVHSLGSGIVIRSDGYIATNFHVVQGAESIVVSLGEATELDAELRGSDPASDLAVLKVDATELPTIRWGNSDALMVGEWVIAIGSPHGLRYSVTAGIVSAKSRRDVGITTFEDFIQTEATINPGNSGGALANLRGEVIGIPTAIISKSGGYEGVSFAIPSNAAAEITQVLIEKGRYPRGWIGIITAPVTRRHARLAALPENAGLVIDTIYRGSPAWNANLRPGDIITKCNGKQVTGLSVIVAEMGRVGTNGTLSLEYIRLERAGEQIRKVTDTAQVSIIPQPIDREGRTPEGV